MRRPYRMRRRAEQVDETRQRITEAAMRLHTSVGPSETSIAAIAEAAGVTRLTVYRHFPDQEALFEACTAHWASLHPAPDPAAWAGIEELGPRARRVLGELYAWYDEVGEGLRPIRRDVAALPPAARASLAAEDAALADALAGPQGTAGTPRARRVRAIAAHLVTLEAWWSLVVEQGLTSGEAAEAGVTWLLAAEGQPEGQQNAPGEGRGHWSSSAG